MEHTHHNEHGTENINMKNYAIGFVLALTLTVVSFGLTLSDVVSRAVAMAGLFLAAVLQMLVHIYYFLHLDFKPHNRWNLISFAFTAILLLIFVGGTLWVMYTLNSRMM